MKCFYCDHFELPLPADHRFPMAKYRLLRERVANMAGAELIEPRAASNRALRRAHSEDYIQGVANGSLADRRLRRVGFPWSPQMVARSRRSVGATMGALHAGLQEGIGVNLAGGTHHAHRERGGGYCVFNDVVVAARWAQARLARRRGMIIDLDVHHGDGTASLCADDDSLICVSMHGDRIYPARKPPSDFDLALPAGTDDAAYLQALERTLDFAASRLDQVDFLIYLAGADPFAEDTLGNLSLSMTGLLARDERVLEFAAQHELPLAVVMAGGYAARIEDIVAIHQNTVHACLRHSRLVSPKPSSCADTGQ